MFRALGGGTGAKGLGLTGFRVQVVAFRVCFSGL